MIVGEPHPEPTGVAPCGRTICGICEGRGTDWAERRFRAEKLTTPEWRDLEWNPDLIL